MMKFILFVASVIVFGLAGYYFSGPYRTAYQTYAEISNSKPNLENLETLINIPKIRSQVDAVLLDRFAANHTSSLDDAGPNAALGFASQFLNQLLNTNLTPEQLSTIFRQGGKGLDLSKVDKGNFQIKWKNLDTALICQDSPKNNFPPCIFEIKPLMHDKFNWQVDGFTLEYLERMTNYLS